MAPDHTWRESSSRHPLTLSAPLGTLDLAVLVRCLGELPDAVLVTDGEGRLRFVNGAAQQLIGCGAAPIPPVPYGEILHLDPTEVARDFVEQCLAGKRLDRAPVRVRDTQGAWLPLAVTTSRLTDEDGRLAGCLAILRDAAADLRHNPEIRHQLSTLASLLDNFPTPFFMVDSSLMITHMNQQLEKLTGYGRAEVANRMTCAQVLSTSQCNTCDCLLKQAMESRQPVYGVRRTVVDREGRKIPVVISASLITDEAGQVIGGFEAIRDITPIVEAERKIELLTEMTQEGILMVDEGQQIIFANSKMGEITGRSKEQLMGMNVRELLPEQHQKMMLDMALKVDRGQQERLRFCSTLQPLRSSQEDYRAFETCMAVVRIGKAVITCLYFRDLTQRVEIERQLRDANSFLENIIRSSVDGIVVVDTEGKVLIFNEGAERILGYQAAEVIGHAEMLRRFYPSEVARENMRRMRSNQYGPPGKLNTTRVSFVRKDGEEVPVNFSAAIIRDGDRELGSVGIFSDMREHLRIRRELEQARIQLLQSEKIASLGRLAAGVAHEINNPLAGILIYADMLMKEVGDQQQWSQDLEEIINQTLRCKQIVTRLLEFSRQQLGQRVAFDVNELLDRCVELLSHQPLFHDVEFRRELSADLPLILGDPGQVQQVLTNLIINAANAMSGKGRLTITSSFDAAADEVGLRFADSGPGIAPEIMDKIFEPFFTTKRPGEGTGLGLSVAYGIVQQHGGKIEAANAPQGGAVFTVTLPLESPEDLDEMIIQ